MYGDYIYNHFQSLSDEMLEQERVSGSLMPEAQKIADDEYARRQREPMNRKQVPLSIKKQTEPVFGGGICY